MTAEERLLMEDETKEQRWNPRMQGFAHNTARTGFLEGEMALPRHDAYTIEFTITKRNPMASDLGDPTDRCTVKLGPNLRNLQEVAVAKNVVDEYAGCEPSASLWRCLPVHATRLRERWPGVVSFLILSAFRTRRCALRVHARDEDRHASVALRVHVLDGRPVVTFCGGAGSLRP